MPFIKYIKEDCKWEIKKCFHPEHNPPQYIVLPEGTHIYKCPSCCQETTIVIRKPKLICPNQKNMCFV